MKLNPRTLILGLIGLGLLAGLLVVAFRTEPIPVDLVTVARGPLEVTVNADGKTRIRDVYDVAAPITGTARRAPVHVGERVIAGETVVAVVEPVAPALLDARSRVQAEAALREAEAGLAQAGAAVVQAEEDMAYARIEFDRARTLTERGVASVTRLENAAQLLALKQAARDAAHSGRAMAEGAVDRAAAALLEPAVNGANAKESCCIELRAPITGVVLSVAVESEGPVSAGTPLVSIGDPADLEIVADLLSSDAVRLTLGTRASVERWGGPEALSARLLSVDPTARTKVSALGIEEQRVDAVFEILSPPEQRAGVGDGFAVYLRIVEWEAGDVLKAPLSALFRQGGGWAVFAEEAGRAVLVPVTLGRRSVDEAEVLSGLAPGQRIVTHPNEAITGGAKIVERAGL